MSSATRVTALSLPAASLAVTSTWPAVPCARATVGVTLQLPEAETLVRSTSALPGIFTVMVSPGEAPLPLITGRATIVRPSPLMPESLAASSTAAGAAGATASTVSLPLRPFCKSVAVTIVPSGSALARLRLQLPLAPTATEPTWVVVPAVSTIVSPGWPVPATVRPLVGATHGTRPLTVAVPGALMLPATSVCTACSTVASASGAARLSRQEPSPSTVASPTLVPAALSTTRAPGEPVPETKP